MTSSDKLLRTIPESSCPVTGLPITTKPEWTEIQLTSDYSVTFSIIGKAILLITPKGYPSEEGTKALLEKRVEFIRDSGLSNRDYVELRDYSRLSAAPSKEGRMILTNFLLQEGSIGHLQGFWVFGAPLLISFMFQAGLRLHKATIPVCVAKDYAEAIHDASNVLRQHAIDMGSKHYARMKKDEWALEIEEHGISFELIGDDILYTVVRGRQKEHHVLKFFELFEKVLQETGLTQKGYYYRILNWIDFESITWKARRMYIERLSELNKKTPCELSVIFGVNKFMKALIVIKRHFVSSPVIVAQNFHNALEIIERERERKTKAGSVRKKHKSKAKIYTEEQLQGFADEMLQIIGGINWDQEGISLDGMSEEHPLAPVLDALAIIKLDLDSLLQDKERSKKSLHESEAMYRFLAENASDTIWIVKPDGTFSYHSPAVKKLRGYTPQEANSLSIEQTITPASLALLQRMIKEENYKPKAERWSDRIVELEMYRKDGMIIWTETSVRAVRDIEGNFTGLQGSTRDITDRKQTEEALRVSEKKYRLIAENTADMISILDLNLHYTYVSPVSLRHRGFTAEEAMDQTLDQVLTPESLRLILTTLEEERQLEASGKGDPDRRRIFELEEYTKDGSTIWVEVNISALRDKDRKPIEFLIVSRDITERKRAEEALQKSEERYRTFVDNASDMVYRTDENGYFTFVNPAALRITGYKKGEIIGKHYKMFIRPDMFKETFAFFSNQLVKKIKNTYYEYPIITRDGHEIWIGQNMQLIMENDLVTGFQSVARDITERRLAEEKLLKSEEKYRNILESIEDGYFEVDLAGNFTFFNASMCRILGYPQEEMLGMNNRAFMDTENAKKIFQAFNKIYSTGIPTKGYECETIRKDGARTNTEVSISLMLNPGGKPTGFRGIARDVTERKIIEAIEQAKLRAEAANKAKSQFLANMSHEIRTPLSGIMGMAEVCLKTKLDADQKHIVGTITKEANSLLGIINEILDFSKIEAGKLVIERVPFDLRNLFEDVVQSFSFQTYQNGLELISSISPEAPARIVGDPGRLKQILRNLIGNAIKFTPKGRIIVKAELAQELRDSIKLRFLVKDTGIGIPKDKQAIIFESFTQADGSTTRRHGGTGLGITISKQLAELMGGEIGVESEEGKGSIFWFTSLFSKQNETDLPKRKRVTLRNLRVLVVNYDKAGRHPFAEYVRSWGAVPVDAASTKEALSILKKSIAEGERICLVLIELNLQEMNGFDLARKIKSVESLQTIPIIIVTSFGNPGDGKTCRDIGVEGYLTKPLGKTELRRTIENVLWNTMRNREIDLATKYTNAELDRKEIRILLAEDYPTNQEIAKRHLEHAGYQVDLAENGKLALEAFKQKHYDLILMDIQMPLMDGYQAAKAIRDIESELNAAENEHSLETTLHRIPIIAITAHALMEDKELCFKSGMDDFLSKPLTQKKILKMAEKWLESRSTRSNYSGASFLNPRLEAGEDIQPIKDGPVKPIDLNRAIDEFEGDKKLLAEVISGFTEKVIEQIRTIREALSYGDADTVKREAHSIKGGAANLTAEDLSKIAFELEIKGKSNELNGAGDIVDNLEREFNLLRYYIKQNFPPPFH